MASPKLCDWSDISYHGNASNKTYHVALLVVVDIVTFLYGVVCIRGDLLLGLFDGSHKDFHYHMNVFTINAIRTQVKVK